MSSFLINFTLIRTSEVTEIGAPGTAPGICGKHSIEATAQSLAGVALNVMASPYLMPLVFDTLTLPSPSFEMDALYVCALHTFGPMGGCFGSTGSGPPGTRSPTVSPGSHGSGFTGISLKLGADVVPNNQTTPPLGIHQTAIILMVDFRFKLGESGFPERAE